MNPLLQWEANLIVWWQTAMPWLAAPMKFFSSLGVEEFFLLCLPVLYWSVNTSLGLRVGILLLISAPLNGFFKLAFHAPRPYWVDARVQALTAEASFGLPSGHAQNAVVVWGTVAHALKRRWAWIAALALILLISLSRIFVGVHFPTDILGGWVIGGLMLWASIALGPRLSRWWNGRTFPYQLGVAFLVSLALLALAWLGHATTSGITIPPEWNQTASAAFPPEDGEPAIDPLATAGIVANAGALFGVLAGWALLIKQGRNFDAGGRWWKRLLRFLIGLAGTAVLLFGLRALLPRGDDLLSQTLRYLRCALTALWIIYLAPVLFLSLKLANSKHD